MKRRDWFGKLLAGFGALVSWRKKPEEWVTVQEHYYQAGGRTYVATYTYVDSKLGLRTPLSAVTHQVNPDIPFRPLVLENWDRWKPKA